MTVDLSDEMVDFRDLLKTQSDMSSLHGGRVYFRIPVTPSYPLMRIYRAGGGKQPGEPNIRDIRFAVEVLGNRFEMYPQVKQLASALESFVDNLDNVAQGGTLFQNGIVTGVVDKPDPDTGWPGRVVDCLVTLSSTTA